MRNSKYINFILVVMLTTTISSAKIWRVDNEDF